MARLATRVQIHRPEIEDDSRYLKALCQTHFSQTTSMEVFELSDSDCRPITRVHFIDFVPQTLKGGSSSEGNGASSDPPCSQSPGNDKKDGSGSQESKVASTMKSTIAASLSKPGSRNSRKSQTTQGQGYEMPNVSKDSSSSQSNKEPCIQSTPLGSESRLVPQLQMTAQDFQRLVDEVGLPATFVQGIFQHQIWDGNGCFVQRNKDGTKVERIDIFFRAEWGLCMYPQVALAADFKHEIVNWVIINAPPAVRERMKNTREIDRPLAIAALILDACLIKWQGLLNDHREELLNFEDDTTRAECRGRNHRTARDATALLHRLCSKTHQMAEHIADLEARVRFLQTSYATLKSALHEHNWPLDHTHSVADSLSHLLSGADTARRWAANYNNRTHWYETMLYHIAAHADSEVNAELSHVAQENARTNLGLSTVAMAFLPGTFVAGVFGMAFFQAGQGNRFDVSHWLWLYAAFTVPITLAVFVVWFVWKRWGWKRPVRDLERCDGGPGECGGN